MMRRITLPSGNDLIQFSARFNGVSREISVPVDAVQGIFAKETSQGILFPPEEAQSQQRLKLTLSDKNNADLITRAHPQAAINAAFRSSSKSRDCFLSALTVCSPASQSL